MCVQIVRTSRFQIRIKRKLLHGYTGTLSLGFSKQLYTSEGGSTQNVGNDDFHYNNPLKLTTLHCITTFHMDTID